MTSVLYGGSLNYQGRNPLQGEIRGIRRELDEIRGLITDLNVRLDKADIPALPEEETVAFQTARAAEAAAAAAAVQAAGGSSYAARLAAARR